MTPTGVANTSLAVRMPQVSAFPPCTVWSYFGLLRPRLGIGRTDESLAVEIDARAGLLGTAAGTGAALVGFPAKVVGITARKIQQEHERQRGQEE